MRSRALAALAAAAALAGCPLPQPLPDYPSGSITPPRILTDSLMSASGTAVTFVPADCTTQTPTYPLRAAVSDSNTIETIAARWFVNYDKELSSTSGPRPESGPVPPNSDTTNLQRQVPSFSFRPYDFNEMTGSPVTAAGNGKAAGILRVVELVVSNGFNPAADTPGAALPWRTPLPGFETQAHRWLFVTVPQSAAVPCCTDCLP